MFTRKLGIDLGTANVLVYVPHKGVVINEPSVVAVSIGDNKVLAIGSDAKDMIGKTPDTIIAYRPLKNGVIADYRVTEAMLKYFFEKTTGFLGFIKPDVMISVPAGITSTERRAVIQAAIAAGAKNAFVVKEPVLASLGAGISINEPSGNMIVDIGGGTSEVAIISLGGIVAWASVRIGGDRLDQAISYYIKKKHNLAIGERTAEDIKINIGRAIASDDNQDQMEIRGRDLVSGLPKNIVVTSNEVAHAISEELEEIIKAIKTVLQDTPPELSADIMDKGMVISGGGALIRDLDKLINQQIGVPVAIADKPLFCVAKGTGIALDNLEMYKRSILSKK